MQAVKPRRIDADQDDISALLSLILRAFASMDGRIDPPSSAHRLTVATLRERARVEIGYVIDGENGPVACLFCKPEAHSLYLGKLAVDPDCQGRGFGHRLLTSAEDLARSLRLSVLRLETRIELTENHAIFARWGFVRTAENRHPGHDRTTSVEMQKLLSPVP